MKLLGIETTTKYFCLALYDNGRVYEYNLELGTRHSELLIPTFKRVLAYLGWEVGQIDYFACGLGPGSFTGVRIGLAAIKGLAWSLQKPVIGIPTLDILAMNARTIASKETILPVVDAKRDLIYCSAYKIKNGTLKRILAYSLLPKKELLAKIKPHYIVFGDALALHKESLVSAAKGIRFLEKDFWYPQGRNIIPLALEKISRRQLSNSLSIKPIYLYPKECQIR
jgi:tRNA threonylcarbamoyladenosine biosynthesis protein TsaB